MASPPPPIIETPTSLIGSDLDETQQNQFHFGRKKKHQFEFNLFL
jgi:hypothetical protein